MDKILYVDDDVGILDAAKRNLRKSFDLVTAENGKEGLEKIHREGPFSLVLSDLQMPGMNGIQFLSQVCNLSPDTVRIMLTGNADLGVAMQAVNEGNIFRFLTKPCPLESLLQAINAGVHQYRLITAERELLEETLSGSVKVLTDLLALANPVAFGRASRVRDYTRQIVEKLNLKEPWQVELAAMLSQIGCITIPSDVLEKKYHGESLTESESKMFQSHPTVGSTLIGHIPRLENVAAIIARQDDGLESSESDIPVGAKILKAILDFDTLLAGGASKGQAIQAMKAGKIPYDPEILEALKELSLGERKTIRKSVRVQELLFHAVLAEDLRSKSGMLLAGKGQEVTPSLKEKLKNFLVRGEIEDKISILIYTGDQNANVQVGGGVHCG